MTFLKSLSKDGWTIYIYSLPDDRYMIEYSNDGFGSKERREYNSTDELFRMLKKRVAKEVMTEIRISIDKNVKKGSN